MDERVTALGIAGSLREGSHNRALIRAAAELAPERLEIDIFRKQMEGLLRWTRRIQSDPAGAAQELRGKDEG